MGSDVCWCEEGVFRCGSEGVLVNEEVDSMV